MNTKNQKPDLRSKIQSASFLLWIMVVPSHDGLISAAVSDGRIRPTRSSTVALPAVVVFTASYGILMLLLWPHEIVSFEGRPERLVP
jgi:hypothetical protein